MTILRERMSSTEEKKRKLAADCFRKGNEAMAKENWDYAVDMLDKSTALDPANLMYRQVKRGCTRKKYGENGTGARMSGMKLMGVRTRIKKCRMKKDWPGVDRAAEEGLIVNPWDAGLHSDLGDACIALDRDDIAVESYRLCVKAEPKNLDYLRKLGNVLRDRGEYLEGVKYWERIQELKPDDEEARTMISKLLTEQTMNRGGYEEAENTREVKAQNAYELDRIARQAAAAGPDGPGQSDEADLQRAIRKDPATVSNYMALADIYRKEKKLQQAADVLKQGLDASGNDPAVREKLEDVELDLMRLTVAISKKEAKANQTNKQFVKKYQALRTELLKREISVFTARIERNPKDPRLKLDLGLRYKQSKEWTKAIPHLQKASTAQNLKVEALTALGECLLNDKKVDLARRQFEKALEFINEQDQVDEYCQVHYALGRIFQSQKKMDKAEHHYTEVLGKDYEYKDVLARLEKLESAEE